MSDTTYTMREVEALKHLVHANTPYVLASAATGLSTLRRLVVRLVSFGTGRKMGIFQNREAALDWLVAQETPPKAAPEEFIADPQEP